MDAPRLRNATRAGTPRDAGPCVLLAPPRGEARRVYISRQVVRVDGGGQNRATYDAPVVQPHVA